MSDNNIIRKVEYYAKISTVIARKKDVRKNKREK